MAISKVSFFKTPQAGDDDYYWTEDDLLDNSSVYQSNGYLMLDVMANDLGGNAKTLYSIDDGNGNPINPIELFNADTLTNGISEWQTTADGNRARINNGKIEFDLSHELPGGVNSLGADEQFTDTFIYAIRLGNGTLSWAHVRITIDGVNDSATITASDHEDTTVVEAGGAANGTPGDPDASGQLTVHDVDAGQNKFQTPASLDGTYGTFTFDENTGAWTYTLSQGKGDALVGGEAAIDTLTVTSFDGTATYEIKVDITGTNDNATISVVGTPDVTVVEAGGAGNGTPGDPDASGQLAVSDVDFGENKFKLPGSLDGTYGTFTFDADSGAWTYTLSQSKADSLIDGEAVIDTLTVESVDGTASYDIKVDVTGSNDNASISIDDSGDTSVVEAGGTANGAAGDPDAAGSLAVSDVDAGENKFKVPTSLDGTYGSFTFDPDTGDWTYLLDEGKADSLTAGETVMDKLTVSSLDGTATYDITVDITGANDAPTLAAENAGTLTDTAALDDFANLVGQLDGDDVDSDDTPMTLAYAFAAGEDGIGAYGMLVVNADGSYTYTPDDAAINALTAADKVTDTFQVQTTDQHGAVAVATLTVNITGANDTPTLVADNAGTLTDTAALDDFANLVGQLDGDDVDSDDTPATLAYALAAGEDGIGTYGTLVVNVDGSYTYTPDDAAINALTAADKVTDTFQVQTTDQHGAVAVATLTVNVTGANDAPAITSNGGGDEGSVSVAENSTAVTTVTATDPDADATLEYAIVGGADAALFAIDKDSGALTFISAPNFEAPGDAGGNNVYDVVVQASDGSLVDTQTLHVTVTNVNEAPVITSNGGGGEGSVSVAENGTTVTTVTAIDPDAAATLEYKIVGGIDAALFAIDKDTGVLSFVSAPNFEAPGDDGGNDVYDVVVQASDGTLVDTQTLHVTVTNASEAPIITSNGGGDEGSVSVAENSTAVTTVAATDPDAGTVLEYKIIGGADAALFAIDKDTGVLSFVSAPNFEAPGDAGGNNVYDVIVQAWDGTLVDTQTLHVTVTDVAENAPPVIGALSANTISEVAQKGTVVGTVLATDDQLGLTYSLTDDAGGRFAINAATGVITLADSSLLDFESFTSHSVTVQVTDSDSVSVTKTFTINVVDVASVASFAGTGSNDTVDGTSGNDTLNGGNGDDILYGGQGDDTLNGGNQIDRLFGQDGNDTLIGDQQNDFVLHGGAGDDTLQGGQGLDLLIGGTGADTMTGGQQIDSFRFLKGDLGTGLDHITDFGVGGAEKLQIGDLLEGFGDDSVLTDFVQATSAGGSTTILIDADGAVGGTNFVSLVVLDGVASVTLATIVDTTPQGTV